MKMKKKEYFEAESAKVNSALKFKNQYWGIREPNDNFCYTIIHKMCTIQYVLNLKFNRTSVHTNRDINLRIATFVRSGVHLEKAGIKKNIPFHDTFLRKSDDSNITYGFVFQC